MKNELTSNVKKQFHSWHSEYSPWLKTEYPRAVLVQIWNKLGSSLRYIVQVFGLKWASNDKNPLI